MVFGINRRSDPLWLGCEAHGTPAGAPLLADPSVLVNLVAKPYTTDNDRHDTHERRIGYRRDDILVERNLKDTYWRHYRRQRVHQPANRCELE